MNIHAQGYISAIEAGVQTVMASYNSWQGTKLHGQRYLLTDVLKGRMGFDGLVVSDWDGIDEVQGCSKDKCARAVNAGIDLFMVPIDWKGFIANTVAQVQAGDIPVSRIDDAVTRILRVKLRAGLFERGKPSSRATANKRELLGSAAHRAVAREAVRKSLVLLKNENGLLPLRPKMNVLVAGDGADNIGKQSGGWTVTWQGTENSNADFPGGTSIFKGIQASVAAAGGTATLSVDGSYRSKPDVAVVVFGENPYAEWYGNIPVLDRSAKYRSGPAPAPEASEIGAGCASPATTTTASAANAAATSPSTSDASAASRDLALLRSLKERGIPVVAVFLTGRPLWITPELEASDAFVVAWLPGSEGGGVADVLFRKPDDAVNHDFTGKLSYSWPRTPQDSAEPRRRGLRPAISLRFRPHVRCREREVTDFRQCRAPHWREFFQHGSISRVGPIPDRRTPMLHHVSFNARDPKRVAKVLAELMDATAMRAPSPPFALGSWFVVCGDSHGSLIELIPWGSVMDPQTRGLAHDPQMRTRTGSHVLASTSRSIEMVMAIAAREGWRASLTDAALFQFVKVWPEDSFALELLTPQQVPAYIAAFGATGLATLDDKLRALESMLSSARAASH